VNWPSSREIFGSFGFAVPIGLPISLIICFAVGYPAWRFASAHGLTTRWDAVTIGAVIGAALCLLVTLGGHIATYMGGGSYSYSRGGVLLAKDSLPTFQGVLFDLFLMMLFYAPDGAVAGLDALFVGGSKSWSPSARSAERAEA
jgi:hypothetical protein